MAELRRLHCFRDSVCSTWTTISEREPILIELSSFGVFSGHQIVYRRGINDEEFERRLSLSKD